jgi:hypothetical protein
LVGADGVVLDGYQLGRATASFHGGGDMEAGLDPSDSTALVN